MRFRTLARVADFSIDNQFCVQAMSDEWVGSDVAVTFSFGGLAIIRRATCMFMMMMLILLPE